MDPIEVSRWAAIVTDMARRAGAREWDVARMVELFCSSLEQYIQDGVTREAAVLGAALRLVVAAQGGTIETLVAALPNDPRKVS